MPGRTHFLNSLGIAYSKFLTQPIRRSNQVRNRAKVKVPEPKQLEVTGLLGVIEEADGPSGRIALPAPQAETPGTV